MVVVHNRKHLNRMHASTASFGLKIVNFKKENRDPEKLPKIVGVCDFIIFEIPILTIEIIYVADHTVKIGISNHKFSLSSP